MSEQRINKKYRQKRVAFITKATLFYLIKNLDPRARGITGILFYFDTSVGELNLIGYHPAIKALTNR